MLVQVQNVKTNQMSERSHEENHWTQSKLLATAPMAKGYTIAGLSEIQPQTKARMAAVPVAEPVTEETLEDKHFGHVFLS